MSESALLRGAVRLPLRTPTLPPATATNTLIVGGSRLVVIEPATPFADEQGQLEASLAALATDGRQVHAVLLTHHHVDHVGYAEALGQRWGVPVIAHARTAERVSFAVDEVWSGGETLDLGEGYRVEAFFTPGHAPGHLVYYEHKTGLAYAGDMLAGVGSILIDPSDDGDMAQYLDSLAILKGIGARALVPSHGDVLSDPDAAVDHTVRHRLLREAKVLAGLLDGPCTMALLLARAYDDTPKVLWPLAARTLEAHVRKLERESLVDRDGDLVTRRDS